MKYDYLVVGAGLFGSVFAYEAKKANKKVLVIDKRSTVGGNVYTKLIENIHTHVYGPHIFHTNDKYIWDYINYFAEFNNFINSPIAIYKGRVYPLPFNMHTFSSLWDISTPDEAKKIIENQASIITSSPQNLEEKAISLVGTDIYEKLIKGYTEKQWGRRCVDLPPSIIERIPVRFCYNNNYFNSRYQGIPINGYTNIILKMLNDIEVVLNCDFISNKESLLSIAHKVIYTGSIDEFYDYRFGVLDYRSVSFDTTILPYSNFQGNAIVNYTERSVPWTRIIEHKWFYPNFCESMSSSTIITKEYSEEWSLAKERFYPINDDKNIKLYKTYHSLAENDENIIFGGRLGEYKYYNMDEVIKSALICCSHEFRRCHC